MNFERKTSQNQFLPILSETQEQKLEKIYQKAISIMTIRNQTHLLTVSVQQNSHFNNTGLLVLVFHRYTNVFWFVMVMLKIGDTAPFMLRVVSLPERDKQQQQQQQTP